MRAAGSMSMLGPTDASESSGTPRCTWGSQDRKRFSNSRATVRFRKVTRYGWKVAPGRVPPHDCRSLVGWLSTRSRRVVSFGVVAS